MGKKIIYIKIYRMERETMCWTYDFGDELSTRKEEKMIYLKKRRNDAVELLPLTLDSLEMLRIQNGESGQKGGRKGKGGRTQRGGLRER